MIDVCMVSSDIVTFSYVECYFLFTSMLTEFSEPFDKMRIFVFFFFDALLLHILNIIYIIRPTNARAV